MENKDNEIKELFKAKYNSYEYASEVTIIENKSKKILLISNAGDLSYHIIDNYIDILKYLDELDIDCFNHPYGNTSEEIIDKFVDNKAVIKENGEYKLFCADKLISIIDKGIEKYCNDNNLLPLINSLANSYKSEIEIYFFKSNKVYIPALGNHYIPFSYFENIDFKRLGELIASTAIAITIKSSTLSTSFEESPIIATDFSKNISIYDIFKDELWNGDINNFIKEGE